MTDIDNMGAGAELDRLVAERVMGWRRTSVTLTNEEEESEHWETDAPRGAFGESNLRALKDFAPSTNIAHAWEVVERLESIGWLLEMYSQGGCWSACLEHTPQGTGNVFRTIARTAPHVLCLVALKAILEPDA